MTVGTLSSLLPLPVVIPIAGAVCAPLAARVDRRLPLVVCMVALAASTLVLGLVAGRVYSGTVLTHYMGHVIPVDGRALGVAFAADPLGLTFGLACTTIGGVLMLSTLSELAELGAKELGGYACLFQLLISALVGSALTGDLFNLFVWFEVAALSSYGLTGFFLERPIALEAAFKVLVLTTLASFAVFVGAALLYSNHGALNFGQLHEALAGHAHTADMVALALLVCGFATKAGLMPFHTWLPDAHTAAPGPVSALFSGLMVNLGVVAIVRVALQVYGPASGRPVLGLLMGLGVVSAILGAVLALAQDDLKRLLAYDTISQVGVLVVGFASDTPDGVAGATYHLVNHALFKALLFLCAGAIVHATGATKLSEMGGLGRHRPGLAIAFTAGVAAIAGVPPLNGYVSLGLIHDGLTGSGQPVVFGAMLVAQTVTIAALGRAAYLAFYRRRPDPYPQLEALRPGMVVALSTLGGACVVFGLFPDWTLDHVAGPAAAGVLHAGRYAQAALGHGGTIGGVGVSFRYLKPTELIAVAGTVAAGGLLARTYIRIREPRAVGLLRAIHNGSVNDYAAYAVLGVIGAAVVLAG
ncbi:MAG TPA: proton-conducting transporter membrane subunit [Solirubrobacteraceae bacterium]|jgi:multicomponent Na+:H+ antiporter subunit D|nr:proton-conducting transporter membrane subunit [Solirubrobacteraceae bacterium]